MDGDKLLELQYKIQADIAEIQVTLGKQAVLLAEHIRRTELAEQRIEDHEQATTAALKPINAHLAFWAFTGKLLTIATAVGGLAVTVAKLLGKL